MKRVLILGSGGREAAIAWNLSRKECELEVFVAPGNGSTSEYCKNIPLNASNFAEIKNAVIENNIDTLIVGPEQALVDGIKDYFEADHSLKLNILGPNANGAKLESSKDYAKKFMERHGIPTAKYKSFDASTIEEAKQFLKTLSAPYVLKADGLAAGKGVLIINDIKEAEDALEEMLLKAKFGSASKAVVIEQFLKGIEMSYFVLTDGSNYITLPEAKDYKRIFDGDRGENTGGMGAVSPVAFADSALREKIENRIVKPTIEGLKAEGIRYVGFIFFGLMIEENGDPYVIEYNVRMGDPETQVVMCRAKPSSFAAAIEACFEGGLDKVKMEVFEGVAMNVVVAAEGYPQSAKTGERIVFSGAAAEAVACEAAGSACGGAKGGEAKGACGVIFGAGVKKNEAGELVSSGGRVLSVISYNNESYKEAQKNVYELLKGVEMRGMQYRRDIGNEFV